MNNCFQIVIKSLTVFLLFGLVLFINVSKAQTYYLYVAAESEDEVYLIQYDARAQEGTIADTISIGEYPTEIEGPHGINLGLDGKFWYLSVAHGNPYGWLYKFKTGTNEFVSRTELGMFPASMEISSATGLLYVVNFNLHGDMEPSTVSVVDPEAMEVVADIPTGIMPHGSRITDDGKRQYHVSMMTDELIEVNTATMQISRRLNIAEDGIRQHDNMDGSTRRHEAQHIHAHPQAKPTWADPHPSSPFVYVANNGSDEVVEVNTSSWTVTRRFKTGKAPYNLEVSEDGKLVVVTYKGEGATGVWDLASGSEIARINNSRRVSHGVTISPDSHFAFVSVEGVGAEPGSVDVIDLEQMILTEVVEVGKQAGGITFWKMEE